MSLFSNKQMRIIFIYCVIIILVICGIITARHKQSSSENPADTSSITNEPPKSSDSSGTSDKSGSSNDSSSSNPSIPSDSDDYRHTTHPIRETELAAVQSWAIAA